MHNFKKILALLILVVFSIFFLKSIFKSKVDSDWAQVSATSGDGIAIKKDGTLWAWGGILRRSPLQVGNDNDWDLVNANYGHVLAIKQDGTLWAWGDNHHGQLGVGDKSNRRSPIKAGNDNDWKQISAGNEYSLALKQDGTLWAWGRNDYGQLGLGDRVNKYIPTQVGTENDWTQISAGWRHSLALKQDGTLWAWGWNRYGQLGIRQKDNELNPILVGIDKDWVQASAGGYHSIALRKDGTLWAWGRNDHGQLGIRRKTSTERMSGEDIKLSPIPVGEEKNWTKVVAGHNHNLALKKDNSVWGWGWNEYGQLCNRVETPDFSSQRSMLSRVSPEAARNFRQDVTALFYSKDSPISVFRGGLQISAGENYSLILRQDNTIWACGGSGHGTFGSGDKSYYKGKPTQILMSD